MSTQFPPELIVYVGDSELKVADVIDQALDSPNANGDVTTIAEYRLTRVRRVKLHYVAEDITEQDTTDAQA